MKIQILGTGCAKCIALEQKVRALNATHHLNAEIEKITDLREMMKYGVLMTPGVVVNGVLKSSGTIPPESQLLEWMKGVSA